MTLTIDTTLKDNVDELLRYFQDRTKECMASVELKYGNSQIKKKAQAINAEINAVSNQFRSNVLQVAQKNNWSNQTILETLLSIQYATSVTLLENRNQIWNYDYMTFSRRIGELWEKFCYLCFEYPCSSIQLFTPPLFKDLKKFMSTEFEDYINKLPISEKQKKELNNYYQKVWNLVTSGDINLQLDCHFRDTQYKYNVDFKSGFGSNEKGNTNRLLLIGTLYNYFQDKYKCVLLVRAKEDENNNYFQTLKQSNVWEAYCSQEAYEKIQEYTGFDIQSWFQNNVHWEENLSSTFVNQIVAQNLEKYIQW